MKTNTSRSLVDTCIHFPIRNLPHQTLLHDGLPKVEVNVQLLQQSQCYSIQRLLEARDYERYWLVSKFCSSLSASTSLELDQGFDASKLVSSSGNTYFGEIWF